MDGQPVPDIDEILDVVDNLLALVDAEAELHPGEGLSTDRSLEALAALTGASQDGFVEIEVSEDGMAALANVYPPVGSGTSVGPGDFQRALEKAGVVFGLVPGPADQALGDTAQGLRPHEGVLVARGCPPVDAVPERWEVTSEAGRPGDPDQPLRLVKSGDLLAVLAPAKSGVPGRDVRGTPVLFSSAPPEGRVPGDNVEKSDGGLRASRDGAFKVDGGVLRVDPVMVTPDGAGPIDFDGDVMVTGPVVSGARIRARGTLVSNRTLDAAEVDAGEDLVAPQGVIGRNGGVLKVGGTARAQFMENVYVHARGPLEIETGALNCSLQTLDRLVMGPKGWLVGGKVQALNGVDLFQVGADRGPKAEVHCGMDFTILDKIAWARDQSLSLVKQLKILEGYMAVHPDQLASLAKAGNKIRAQVLKLSELSRDLAARIDRNDGAVIVVRGRAFPGTYLEICHVSYVVTRPVDKVKFFLDKRAGIIRTAPL